MNKSLLRILAILILVTTLAYTASDIGLIASGNNIENDDLPNNTRNLDGATIISSQSGSIHIVSDSGETTARISQHDSYFDADLENSFGSHTISYVAVNSISSSECPLTSACTENILGLHNISTGESETLFSQTIPAETAPQWHDADYINDDKFAVADMSRDRIFIVNTSIDIIKWQWQADQHFSLESGDDSAQDWTHLNDVEVLPNGRLMVSMRNQDRVIFINQTTGVDESWTLGEEQEAGDRNKILYEQHNPDFIPDEDGGPAIIVADSEQNRVVEFQRVNNSWKETWEYNTNLDWPRDADRLPNGHTLITDSRNSRVIEINESNSVIYEKEIPLPYEAERVGTGPESKNGKSAIRENLSSPLESNTQISTLGRVESLMPDVIVNTISFLLSKYPLSLNGLVTSSVFVTTSLMWGILEWRWSDWYVQRPIKNRK